MQVNLAGKYDLKDLYDEIGLMDRKIAYCESHEKFDSDDARASALKKLVNKREMLVSNARKICSRGVECDDRFLPVSLRAVSENGA